jgi:hypothetical protein
MKPCTNNKTDEYSLQNIDNYKKELDAGVSEIIKTFSSLLIEYFKFITENFKNKKTSIMRFIITRGLDTIVNVFLNILYYTKNLNVTLFHCQKSFYFYVEFVGQITEDEKMFLQLTSRDATTYVYKKTVFEINNEIKKTIENQNEETNKSLREIKLCIDIYKIYLQKTINEENIENFSNNIELIDKIFDKLNLFCFINFNQTPNLNTYHLELLETITRNLHYNITDVCKFYEVNYLILKKTIKIPELLQNVKQNLKSDALESQLNANSDKLVNFLLSTP